MLLWAIALLLCANRIFAAEVIKIPLIAQRGDGRGLQNRITQRLAKRGVGYSPLIDHVRSGAVDVDIAYLGAVSIGTPPQSFLVCNPLATYF